MPAGDPDTIGDPEAQPAPNPSGAIAERLFGDWWHEDDVGDCVDFRSWYSFAADGSVWNRHIDHNACSGNRLIDKVAGAYSLDGRTLQLRLHGMGSERPFDMSTPAMEVTQRSEVMTIAIADAPVIGREPHVFLDGRAFTSSDGTTFESLRGTLMTSAGKDVLFRQQVAITLQLNPGLPLAAGDRTTVRVRADLTAFDVAAGDTAEKTATWTLEYDATIREELGWLRIMPDALEGLDGQAAIDAWHGIRDANYVASPPEWALRLLEAELYPSQRFMADNTNVLSSTLPEWGRWTQSAEPPPIL